MAILLHEEKSKSLGNCVYYIIDPLPNIYQSGDPNRTLKLTGVSFYSSVPHY